MYVCMDGWMDGWMDGVVLIRCFDRWVALFSRFPVDLRLGATLLFQGCVLYPPAGDRVTVAAGIRLSTRKVYKVATLDGKLAGLVLPDVEFDVANRSGRSRAAGSCREIL